MGNGDGRVNRPLVVGIAGALVVLAAILLPYAFTGFAKFQGGFGLNENKNPREFLEKLGGARKRAHWCWWRRGRGGRRDWKGLG